MNAENFAEWFRRQGLGVVRTTSSFWYEANPHVYQAFPYHWLIQPAERELNDFMRQRRVAALRYSTPMDSPEGMVSYHAVCTDRNYSLEKLDRRSRQNVRNGMNKCHVMQIPVEVLAEEGWLLESDTANRQGRRIKTTADKWRMKYLSAADLPGFEAWGAMVEGRLVASLFTIQVDDWCEMISQQCHRDYLNARVNNALAYFVTKTMMERHDIQGIFYTLQSLDAPANVDEFKFRMGYVARPVRQRAVFHPWVRPLLGRGVQGVARKLLERDPSSQTLAKAEGLLRFYMEGKKPKEAQSLPECLLEHNENGAPPVEHPPLEQQSIVYG